MFDSCKLYEHQLEQLSSLVVVGVQNCRRGPCKGPGEGRALCLCRGHHRDLFGMDHV